MLPSIEDAKRELDIAAQLNPGPWVKHSLNVGIAARNIAQKVPGLDEEKAYVVGMLHDIGRRVGIVNIPKHVYEGYRYSMKMGCSIYDVLPDIGRTTLLCPPPWKPPVDKQ